MKSRMLFVICSLLVVGSLAPAKTRSAVSLVASKRIQKEVRHELMMLPFLSVFENLAFQMGGADVIFVGQVNTNGLLRQYFPRRTDLSSYTQDELDEVALRLNQRPRKTLGFQTPASKPQQSVASTG